MPDMRTLTDLGSFLISPEDSRAKEHRRWLENSHPRPRWMGSIKIALVLATSVALTIGLGQLR